MSIDIYKLLKWQKHIVFWFAVVLYINTVPNNYNLDDELVTATSPEHPHRLTSKGISAIPEIFTQPYYKDDQGYAYDYRPMVLATFALEHSLFGDNIHVSHLVNVLLYALLCLIMWRVLSALFNTRYALLPFVATLLFIVHPAHTEVVASAKNRDELLALLFALLSLDVSLHMLKRKWLAAIISSSLFLLALMSKQTIIPFIVIIPLTWVLFTRLPVWYSILFTVISGAFFVLLTSVPDFWFLVFLVCALLFAIIFYTLLSRIENRKELFSKVKENFSFLIIRNSSRQEDSTKDAIEIGIRSFIFITAFIFLVSAVLFALGSRFYLIPISLLYPIAYFLESKGKTLGLYLALVISLMFAITSPVDFPLSALVLYFVVFTRFYPMPIIKVLAAAIILMGIILASRGIDIENQIVFSCLFYILFFLGNKPVFKWYSAIVAFFLLILAVVIIGQKGPWYDFIFLGGQCITLAALSLKTHKYARSIISLVIIVGFVWNMPLVLSSKFREQVKENVLTYQKPLIIKKSDVERPIHLVENISGINANVEYKLGIATEVWRKYASLLIIPYPLSYYYGFKKIDNQSLYKFGNLFTLSVILFLGFFSIVIWKRWPIITLGLLTSLTALMIFSNIILPAPGMMADRFLFILSFGYSLLLSFLLVGSKKTKAVIEGSILNFTLVLILISLILSYSVLSVVRNNQWKDHLTLFSSDIDHLKNSAQANNLYALQLMKYSFDKEYQVKQEQMWERAEDHFKLSTKVFPEFSNAIYDLARNQNLIGKQADAESNFYKAGMLNPEYSPNWISAGELAIASNKFTQAKQYFLKGLVFHNNDPTLYSGLSLVHYRLGFYDSANIVNKEAMRVFPFNAEFPTNIGQTFVALNQKDSARVYFEKAISLAPNDQKIKSLLDQLH